MDFVFAHFLAFFFGEAVVVVVVVVIVVVVIDRLVGVQVELDVTGREVDGMCVGKSSEVGGVRAGLVGTLGAGVISRGVVAVAVGAFDCGAFRVEDGDLGVLGCVVGVTTKHTLGASVAAYGLVAKAKALLALDSL